MVEKRGQIWIETVIYVLIGLSVIAIIIGIMTPKLKQMTDRSIIEQSLSYMVDLHEKILATQTSPGNVRIVEIVLKKGELVISSNDDKISFVLPSTNLEYSDPGIEIQQGGITILTQNTSSGYNVSLILDYSNTLNITYDNREEEKIFTQSSTAHRIQIENKGKQGGGKNVLDIISL